MRYKMKPIMLERYEIILATCLFVPWLLLCPTYGFSVDRCTPRSYNRNFLIQSTSPSNLNPNALEIRFHEKTQETRVYMSTALDTEFSTKANEESPPKQVVKKKPKNSKAAIRWVVESISKVMDMECKSFESSTGKKKAPNFRLLEALTELIKGNTHA